MSPQHKIGSTLRQIVAAALMASLCVIGAASVMSAATTPASAQQPQQPPPQQVTDDVRAVLSQYGTFVGHKVYGEVWIPSVTPQGWHPYPACHWVNSKQFGWYFDDNTPWGAIVHHYGRWTNDPQVGWFWVPGSEFSPGWVLWRTSPQWVGWAPMPPDEQIQNANPDQFNSADFWIFTETSKFGANCDGNAVVAGQPGLALVQRTVFVHDVNIVAGILVYVLPSYVVGPLVNINVNFNPWQPWFFGQILIDWNWIWNNVNIVNINVANCPPPISPAVISKPPSGGNSAGGPSPSPPPPPPPPAIFVTTPCPGGLLPNAYGQCPSQPVGIDCGPNAVAKGNFCIPIKTPCSGGGCNPIIVTTQPDCGPYATNVGGRCTPLHSGSAGITTTIVVNPVGGSNNLTGGNNPPHTGPDNNYCLKCGDCCVLRHPSNPTLTSTNPTVTTAPVEVTKVNKLPTTVFTTSQSSNTSYVLGRGGAGLNTYKPSTPTNTSISSTPSSASSSRATTGPILHALPTMANPH